MEARGDEGNGLDGWRNRRSWSTTATTHHHILLIPFTRRTWFPRWAPARATVVASTSPSPPTQRPTLLFPHPRTAQDLVPALGIGKGDGGFDLAELMEWVGKTYNSANGEVRSTAVRVTKEVHDLVGPALR